jgi:hypothetical protein
MRPPGFGNESSAYLVVDLKLLRWMECLGLSRILLAQLPVRRIVEARRREPASKAFGV